MLVVPVYNMILAPDATLFFQMDQLRRSAGDKGITVNEKVILIVAPADAREKVLSVAGQYRKEFDQSVVLVSSSEAETIVVSAKDAGGK